MLRARVGELGPGQTPLILSNKFDFSAQKLAKVINLYTETSNLPVCHTLNDRLHFWKKIIFYLVTKLTFFPLFILFIIQESWMLLESGQWLLSERFWNCQYNSFRNWQSLKETVQIELIFNPIPVYQNIMINLSLSVFGAIENLKYVSDSVWNSKL